MLSDARAAGIADRVSVYFRDLNDGLVFGINEDDKFAPVSLLKLPAIVATVVVAEDNPGFLKESLPYTAESIGTMAIPKGIHIPTAAFKPGEQHTLEDYARAIQQKLR